MSTRYSTRIKVFFLTLGVALAPVSSASILIQPNGASVTQDTEPNGTPVAQDTETQPAR